MSALYIKEQGAYLEKRGERIIVKKNRQTLLDIPVANVENIAMIGNVQVTMQLLQELMRHGIDVSYFTFGGKYLGHTSAESSRNIFLRLSQYQFYQDMGGRLAMARSIVRNKISNQIRLIKQYSRYGTEHDWKEVEVSLCRYQESLETRETIQQIMGVEGICSQIYFKAYGKMFKCHFRFEGRNRRPPRDPINVILSLGYTFLTREVSLALETESFEMYLGFLHGLRYGRKSLPLDIVEEFRQPIIDRLALRLFNKGMLGEYDFEVEEDAVRLTEEGFDKFCREFERWMTDKMFSDNEMGFRSRIKAQAAILKQAIQKKTPYQPYTWKEEERKECYDSFMCDGWEER